MKINWAYLIVGGFSLFVLGIVYMVVKASGVEHQLVTTNYYEKELKYQETIDARINAAALTDTLLIAQTDKNINILWPSELQSKPFDAQVHLYCAFEQRNDVMKTIEVKNGLGIINLNQIVPGIYTVKTSWMVDDKPYYAENKIELK